LLKRNTSVIYLKLVVSNKHKSFKEYLSGYFSFGKIYFFIEPPIF
jgi:hypothetical protein